LDAVQDNSGQVLANISHAGTVVAECFKDDNAVNGKVDFDYRNSPRRCEITNDDDDKIVGAKRG